MTLEDAGDRRRVVVDDPASMSLVPGRCSPWSTWAPPGSAHRCTVRRDRWSPSRTERRAPWQRRSAEILRQARASAREASLHRPDGDVPFEHRTMSVPGGLGLGTPLYWPGMALVQV